MYGSGMGGDNPSTRVAQCMRRGDVDGMMSALQAFVERMSKGVSSHLDNKTYYSDMLYTTCALGSNCEITYDVPAPQGYIDVLIEQRPYYYAFKFKRTGSGGVQAAAEQMKVQDYLHRYARTGQYAYGVAVEIPDRGIGIVRWKEVTRKNIY